MPPVNVATMPNGELIQYIIDLSVKQEKLQIDHAAAFKSWFDNRAEPDLVEGYDTICIALTRKITSIRNNLRKANMEKQRRDVEESRYQGLSSSST
jgi:hypothetical protein